MFPLLWFYSATWWRPLLSTRRQINSLWSVGFTDSSEARKKKGSDRRIKNKKKKCESCRKFMHFECKFSRLNYTCILNVSFIPALGVQKRNDVALPQTCQEGLWRPDAVIYCFQPGMSSAETTLSEDSGLVSSSEREESLTVIGNVVVVSVDFLNYFFSLLNPRQVDPVSSPRPGPSRWAVVGPTGTRAPVRLLSWWITHRLADRLTLNAVCILLLRLQTSETGGVFCYSVRDRMLI